MSIGILFLPTRLFFVANLLADVHPCLLSNLHRFMGFGPSGLIFVDMHYYKKYRNYPLIIQLFSYIMWTCMSPAPLGPPPTAKPTLPSTSASPSATAPASANA